MTAPPYTADPVETIIQALARGIGPDKARAMFLEGVELNWIRRAVVNMGAGDDPYRILRAAFETGGVTLVPNIGPIRDVRERRGLDRWDFGGVYLYTDREKVVADSHLLRLLPSSGDPGSALESLLTANPRATRKEALKALRGQFDISGHAFEHLWPRARKDAGLPPHASPGRPRQK